MAVSAFSFIFDDTSCQQGNLQAKYNNSLSGMVGRTGLIELVSITEDQSLPHIGEKYFIVSTQLLQHLRVVKEPKECSHQVRLIF